MPQCYFIFARNILNFLASLFYFILFIYIYIYFKIYLVKQQTVIGKNSKMLSAKTANYSPSMLDLFHIEKLMVRREGHPIVISLMG